MSQEYFTKKLNYSLGNEDTALEVAILPENAEHVFCVAGSGGRVVPLLAKNPKRITCVDVSPQQLLLTELRMAALRAFSFEEYLSFWGYPPTPMTPLYRKQAFAKLALSEKCKTYFHELFSSVAWESILYLGKWESMFVTLSQVNQRVTGERGANLFESRTLEEQREYLKNSFPRVLWHIVLLFLGNASVFNALLYKGDCAKKNIPESFVKFYARIFQDLFSKSLVRENFFLQLCFFGKMVYAEGGPAECDRAIFDSAKKAVSTCLIDYKQGDVIELAKSAEVPLSFYSLSDVPSYFVGPREQNYLQELAPTLAKDAIIVLRYYLHIPEGTNKTGFEDITQIFAKEIALEKVGVYHVEVLRWKG